MGLQLSRLLQGVEAGSRDASPETAQGKLSACSHDPDTAEATQPHRHCAVQETSYQSQPVAKRETESSPLSRKKVENTRTRLTPCSRTWGRISGPCSAACPGGEEAPRAQLFEHTLETGHALLVPTAPSVPRWHRIGGGSGGTCSYSPAATRKPSRVLGGSPGLRPRPPSSQLTVLSLNPFLLQNKTKALVQATFPHLGFRGLVLFCTGSFPVGPCCNTSANTLLLKMCALL